MPSRPCLDALRRSGALLLLFTLACVPDATTDTPSGSRQAAPFAPGEFGESLQRPVAPPRPLAILRKSPIGEEVEGRSVRVQFNQPVVVFGDLDAMEAPGLLTIEPPVAGKVYWQTPDQLVFDAIEPFPRARTFKVTLTTPLEAVSGERLEEPVAFTFQTRGLGVVSMSPSDRQREVAPDALIEVAFNDGVALEEVRRNLTMTARPVVDHVATGEPRSLAFDLRYATEEELEHHYGWNMPDHLVILKPRKALPKSHEITVTVAAGTVGKAGPIGLAKAAGTTFATWEPLEVVGATCGKGDGCVSYSTQISVSNPMMEKEFRRIKITPPVENLVMEVYGYGGTGAEVSFSGRFVPEREYTVHVPAGLEDIHGQKLGKAFTHTAYFEFAPEMLELESPIGVVRSASMQHVGLVARHVGRVSVRTRIVSEAQLAGLAREGHDLFNVDTWKRLEVTAPTFDKVTSIKLAPDPDTRWVSMALDVEALTGDKTGVVVVDVEATEAVPGWKGELPGPARGVYHVTDLAPFFMASPTGALLRVVRLSNGAPVAGVEAELWGPGRAAQPLGRTNRDGFLELTHDSTWATRNASVRVHSGADGHLVYVDDVSRGERTWPLLGDAALPKGVRTGESLKGRLVTERDLYMPGERVSMVGFVAIDSPYAETGLRRLPQDTEVELSVENGDGLVVATETVKTMALGKFFAQLQLPAEGQLGTYRLTARLAGFGEVFSTSVKVKEFRVPEFKVDAVVRDPEIRADQTTTADVSASFYFGGPTPIKASSASMHCTPIAFTAKGLEGWAVGLRPEWRHYGIRPTIMNSMLGNPRAEQGSLTVPLRPEGRDTAFTRRCTSSVAVKDVSEQWSGAEVSFTVHPADAYVAVRTPRTPPVEGGAVSFEVRGVDWKGERADVGEVQISFERTYWEPKWATRGARRYVDRWESKTVKAGTCKVRMGAAGEDGSCRLAGAKAGSYELTARADVGGHETTTKAWFWVSDRTWVPRFAGGDDSLTIEVDRDEVAPGESIRVAIHAPWKNTQGMLLVHRRGVREHIPFALKGEQAVVTLPVQESWLPEATIEARLFVPSAVEVPRVESTTSDVVVTTAHRRLQVTVSTAAEGRPGDKVPVQVQVRDAVGRPVAGRVAVWAVDEAVLDLTDYRVPDLLQTLLPGTGYDMGETDELSRILEPYNPRLYDGGFGLSGFGMGGGGSGYGGYGGVGMGSAGAGSRPSPRANFQITPLFVGDAETDAAGQATVTLVLPDNLTSFRVTAVASASLVNSAEPGRYGDGESSIRSRTELVVRAALPRALRPGDRATVSAIVNNGFGPAGTLSVTGKVVDGEGALAFVTEARGSRAIGAGEQARFPFEVVASAVGTPRVEFRVVLTPDGGAPAIEDAIEVPVPVVPEPTLVDRVAVYGNVADDTPLSIPLLLPADARPDVGGLSLTATSSMLGGLQDASQALISYPYGCAEQTASRLLPMVALSALSEQYDLGGESPKAFVQFGVQRLLSMVTRDGGFSYWPGVGTSNPQVTAYILWVLHLARQAGYAVPESVMKGAAAYLVGVTATPDRDWSDAVLYYHDIRRAMAVHVLAELGQDVKVAVDELWDARVGLPLFARAFLLSAMHRSNPADPRLETLLQDLTNHVEETAATATTRETLRWGLWEFFHSDTRSSAILLMAMLRVAPQHPLVIKLAAGLLDARRKGTWRNTQENAYAIVALSDYARVYEAAVPDFKGRVWVEDRPVIETSFKGRDFAARTGTFAMADLLQMARSREGDARAPLDVTVQRTGAGRMYYRLGFEYAWADAEKAPARERGMAVIRRLRTRDGSDVTGGAVKAGDTVALDLEVRVSAGVHFVAVNVPIPAGLEAIHGDLGKGQDAMTFVGVRGSWVSHEELRKDRVVVFADSLPSGTWTHTIFLKATSPGSFVMPPAVAEAMYEPEVFGRSTGTRLAVE